MKLSKEKAGLIKDLLENNAGNQLAISALYRQYTRTMPDFKETLFSVIKDLLLFIKESETNRVLVGGNKDCIKLFFKEIVSSCMAANQLFLLSSNEEWLDVLKDLKSSDGILNDCVAFDTQYDLDTLKDDSDYESMYYVNLFIYNGVIVINATNAVFSKGAVHPVLNPGNTMTNLSRKTSTYPKRYKVNFLKLNDDPDVTDLGIFAYSVVIENHGSANLDADINVAKTLINGLGNDRVLPEHRVEELDDLENIALREAPIELDTDDEKPLGLIEYSYRTDRDPNITFKISPF